MARLLKEYIVEELKQKLADVDGVVVVNFTGLSVDKTETFRTLLAEQDLSMTVVKNSLAALACESLGMGEVAQVLDGQVAFLYGENEGVITVSRILRDFSAKNKELKIRGGYLEGTLLGPEDVAELAKMPTRLEMIGRVMGQILSPGANLGGALLGPGGRIAGCLESRAEELEKGGAEA